MSEKKKNKPQKSNTHSTWEEGLQPQSAEYFLYSLLAKVNNKVGVGQIKEDIGFL